MHVADATAGARLGAGKRRDARGEVVRLSREDDVVIELRGDKRRGFAGARREDGADRVAANAARVVLEGNHAVVRVRLQGLLDQGDQVLRNLLPVDDQPAFEKPMARVLAVRLRDVEALYVRRVAADPVDEQVGVVVEVPIVEGESQLLVDALQGSAPLTQERNLEAGLRRHARLEAPQRLGVRTLRHPVVHQCQEGDLLPLAKRPGRAQQVAPRALDPPDLPEAAGVTDRDRVGGPGGAEVHARAHLEDVALAAQEAPAAQPLGLEGLAEQPA